MTGQPTARTKTDVALHAIRERILSGELQPGDRVRPEALTAELEMSPTPIREALRLLQADRLVHYKPHHGIVVAGLSSKEIEDIYLVRALLEPLASEMATPAVRASGMDRLEAIHAKLVRQASGASKRRDVGALNAEWHWAIYRACDSSYLVHFIEQLWDRFPWRTMWTRPEDVERSISEHEAIMAAIRTGDAARTGHLMREHVLGGTHNLLDALLRNR